MVAKINSENTMNNIFKVASVLMVLACCGCQNSASSDYASDDFYYPYVKDRGVRHKPTEAHYRLVRGYDRRLEQQPRDLVIDRYSKDWYALKRYIDRSSKIHRIDCPPNAVYAPTLCNYLYILDWGEACIRIDKDYRILIGHVNEKNEQLFIKELKRIINKIAVKEPAWLPVKHRKKG